MKTILVTEYVIRYDPRMKGWIAFKVQKTSDGRHFGIQDRSAVTNPKPEPHLAARALARVLKG